MTHKLKRNLITPVLSIVLFLSGCHNEEMEHDDLPNAVTNAKKWFDTNKPNLDVLGFTKTIDWNNAIVTENAKGNTIEIPLILIKNTTTNIENDNNYNTYMRLLFIEDKEETYKIFSIIFTTKNNTFDNNNKEFNFYNVDPEYIGYLTLQSSTNKILFSGKYQNGKLIAVPKRAKNQKTARWVCSYAVTVGTYTNCTSWSWVWDPYDPEWLLVQRGWSNMDDYNNTYGDNAGNSDPITDPCALMKEQMANANFLSKQEELSKKTNLKVETGYTQSNHGPFTALPPAASTASSDGLKIKITADMKGFIHSHLDDYETGIILPDGSIEVRKAIRMFSPADIDVFLQLVQQTQNNGISIDSIYGMMVSSSGTYQLRFTGDPKLINQNFDWESLNEVYKTYFEKNKNPEKGFLKFLKEKGNIEGIELYKINKDKTATQKLLDPNGNVVNSNC